MYRRQSQATPLGYEIILGSADNTKSALIDTQSGETKQEVDTPDLLQYVTVAACDVTYILYIATS